MGEKKRSQLLLKHTHALHSRWSYSPFGHCKVSAWLPGPTTWGKTACHQRYILRKSGSILKVNIYRCFDWTFVLLGIYPEEILVCVCVCVCTWILILNVYNWGSAQIFINRTLINKAQYIHTNQGHPVIVNHVTWRWK